jgi:thioredoxin reductase (NADPH)
MTLTVVVLCAAWCTTCNEFRPVITRVAQARPGLRLVWLDIEDDSAICGDVDVEDFPTLAVFRGDALLHFGPSLPHEQTVARLLTAMADPTRPALARSEPAVSDMMRRLRSRHPT